MKPPLILRNDASHLDALIAAGRKAAALDGRHLLLWGAVASVVLALQYAAEVGDWLPSEILWLWQPAALLGFVAAIFAARRGAGRRLGHPVARAYATGFALSGLIVAVFMIATGFGARPSGLATAVLVTGAMGCAFLNVALATPLRWMALPGLAWLLLAAFFIARQEVVPADWLRLSLAFAFLLALPGAVLIAREPQ